MASTLKSIPSWMGDMYKPVAGTGFYSTNPSNPNANKFYADGRPVATVGYDNQQTGQHYNGFATPEQFSGIVGAAGNPNAQSQLISGMLSSGQLNMGQYQSPPGYASSGAPSSTTPGASSGTHPSEVLSTTSTNDTAAAPVKTGTLNKLTPTQQAAQDWINNQASYSQTGISGGLAGYIGAQQKRYADAVKSGDLELANRLKGDAARVGYSLEDPVGSDTGGAGTGTGIGGSSGPPGINEQGVTDRITKTVGNEIAQAIQALNQANAQTSLANNSAVSQNNAALEENLARLREQQAQELQDAETLQNRRGGFYSGGLDYQRGSITKTYGQQQGNVQRDTEARNQDIFAKNALLASQVADKIAMLQTQAPDKIRELVQQEIDRQRQMGIQEAGLTGTLNGQRTIAGQQVDRQIQQDHLDLAKFLTQTFGVPVTPTDNPMQAYAQVAGIPTLAARKIMIDAEQQGFDNAIKKALAENTINETQAKLALQAQEVAISQQNANTSSKNADTSASNAQTNADQAAWEKDPNNPKNKPKDDSIKNLSAKSYSEFLADLPRVASRNEGLTLIEAYRSKGVDEKTLQNMTKDINTQFKS